GFIDDVEAVLKKTPAERQVALFSATMPAPIRRIAQTYLRNPQEIAIEVKTRTADNIRQRFWQVSGLHKLDALTRILEAEPFDTESYVHRIGRTGRAGRSGEAILFIAPRERNLLRSIERATRQPIEQMELPSVETINDVRIAKFKQQITDTLEGGGLELFQRMTEEYEQANNVPAVEIASALAKMFRGDVPLLLK